MKMLDATSLSVLCPRNYRGSPHGQHFIVSSNEEKISVSLKEGALVQTKMSSGQVRQRGHTFNMLHIVWH